MATERTHPSIPATVGACGKLAGPVPDVSGELFVTEFYPLSLGPCDCSLVLPKIEVSCDSILPPITGDKFRPNRLQPFGGFGVAIVGSLEKGSVCYSHQAGVTFLA